VFSSWDHPFKEFFPSYLWTGYLSPSLSNLYFGPFPHLGANFSPPDLASTPSPSTGLSPPPYGRFFLPSKAGDLASCRSFPFPGCGVKRNIPILVPFFLLWDACGAFKGASFQDFFPRQYRTFFPFSFRFIHTVDWVQETCRPPGPFSFFCPFPLTPVFCCFFLLFLPS